MPFNEATFWFGLTIFGTGLYFVFEGTVKLPYAITLIILGAIGSAYSVYRHSHPESLKPLPLWVLFLALTWLAIGYNYVVHSRQGSSVRALEPSDVKETPTKLRLQFNAANTLPLEIGQENIWRWYTLKTVVRGKDVKTRQPIDVAAWTIFVVFDRPVNFRQIRVDTAGMTIPGYEVKDSSQRSAVIFVAGDLVGVPLSLEVI